MLGCFVDSSEFVKQVKRLVKRKRAKERSQKIAESVDSQGIIISQDAQEVEHQQQGRGGTKSQNGSTDTKEG